MKIGCIGWWESSSVIATTRTSPLDSRLRGNDDLGGRNDECEGISTDAGMTRPTVVTANIHPGSESGTCFRTNDDVEFADIGEMPAGQCVGYIHQPQAKLQYQHEFVGSR